MRILFIFPHPDDESFGPAGAIHKLSREGHDVHLLTLTKGGATKERHKFGMDIEEMGLVREKEMREMAKVLRLKDLEIWDLPDSGLLEMDPRELEKVIQKYIEQLQPAVVVTYAVQGVSGFADHLVTHAVVKRVYLEMREKGAAYLKRLAFFGLSDRYNHLDEKSRFRLHRSPDHLVDCVVELDEEDVGAFHAALDCYATYQDVIHASRVKETLGDKAIFEFFQESFDPPVKSLVSGLI
jgi:N-acetylglucosamine malate deacetylase 2